MSFRKLLFVLHVGLACYYAQANSEEIEDMEAGGPFWSQLASLTADGPIAVQSGEPQVDHFLRAVRQVLEAKARRNTERDHYLRTLRSGPTTARDHYLRSLRRSEKEAETTTRDHYFRSLKSDPATPMTRDHYLRSLRSDEATPTTRDHYLRSLRADEATPTTRDHYLRSLRSIIED